MNKKFLFFGIVFMFVAFGLVQTAFADSTVGTNMSTTGTFTQTVGSATAARFQNAAGTTTVLWVDTTSTLVGVNAGGAIDTTFEVGGTASISGIITFGGTGTTGGQFRPASNGTTAFRFQNAAGTSDILTIDTTNNRVGIGGTPTTIFEVQGTASASYLKSANTIQVGGYASVAYNRFGTNATTQANDIAASNDFLVSGNLEVDLKAYFDAPAEFQGTASASYLISANTIQVGGYASVAYNRFGTTATTHSNFMAGATDFLVNGDFEVDASAQFDSFVSVSTAGSTSFTVDSSSATVGSCLVLKDVDGSGHTYLRVSNGVAMFTTVSCK